MPQRDKVKVAPQKSGSSLDRSLYWKLRNTVTKFNDIKKKQYFKQKNSSSIDDSEKLWKALNEIMCKKSCSSQMYVECAGQFITRPYHVANYFNNFSNKVV